MTAGRDTEMGFHQLRHGQDTGFFQIACLFPNLLYCLCVQARDLHAPHLVQQ